jgi:hypothetical protein
MVNYGPFGQVADLGCGDGVLAYVLLHVDPDLKVDAYDVPQASLERARALIATLHGAAGRSRLLRIDLNTCGSTTMWSRTDSSGRTSRCVWPTNCSPWFRGHGGCAIGSMPECYMTRTLRRR